MCLKLNADIQKWQQLYELGKLKESKLQEEVNMLRTKLEVQEGNLFCYKIYPIAYKQQIRLK